MRFPLFAWLTTSALILLIALNVPNSTNGAEFRSIDGSGNNLVNPAFGQADIELIRLLDNAYLDGVSAPRGGQGPSSLPSPRLISNTVAAQPEPVGNSLAASDWLWQWGQFIDHDMDFTPVGLATESFAIPVPEVGDHYFNPNQMTNVSIPFGRSMPATGTGTSVENPRQQMNQITSYIDASMIYGSDVTRAAALRNTINPARLETSMAQNGEVLPMKNSLDLPNDNGGSVDFAQFFLSGDVRANEQIGLTATHSLFVREHNRIVADLSDRLLAGETALVAMRVAAIADNSNNVNNESDFLYESARKLLGAQVQKITYEEFLPILIGDTLGIYNGYDSSIDASVSNEFASAAYRLGHTLLSAQIQRPGMGEMALQDAFFNPAEVEQNGVDALLLGLAQQQAQQLDNQLVDGVRNFLFGPPGAGGLDLASLNIQRGRDHGLPSYTDAYAGLFQQSITSFSDLGSSGLELFSDEIVELLESAYETVDEIDLWIAGISELPADHGGLLGPTFSYFLADQFGRTRDGDRFFYLDQEILEDLVLLSSDFGAARLSDIIRRNSTITDIQSNVFVVLVPEPSSLALLMITNFLLWTAAQPKHLCRGR